MLKMNINLKQLKIRQCSFTEDFDDVVRALAFHTNLEDLELSGVKITSQTVSHLGLAMQ